MPTSIYATIDQRIAQYASNKQFQNAKVIYVYDGDTVKIQLSDKTIHKARLYNIETIETRTGKKLSRQSKRCRTPKPVMLNLAHKAKSYAMRKLLRQKIKFLYMGKDPYKRWLIWIQNFNYDIIADGYAKVYYTYGKRAVRDLVKLSDNAKRQQKGLWATIGKYNRKIPKKCY